MEYVNKSISLHKYIDFEWNLLLDSHYEVFDLILSCSNQEKLPLFCSSQDNEYFQKYKIWDSTLSLCVVPQTFNFPELIDGCASYYSIQNLSIISQVSSKILFNHKYWNNSNYAWSRLDQFRREHSLQKPENLFQNLNFPLKAEFFQDSIQLILSMFVQITGVNHDYAIPKSFLGFMLFLSEETKFNYPKYISDAINDQFTSYSSLRDFQYQSYLVYLILYKYPLNFDTWLDIQDLVPYSVISIIQKSSFVRNQCSGFFQFIEQFISQAYNLIYEEDYPRVC